MQRVTWWNSSFCKAYLTEIWHDYFYAYNLSYNSCFSSFGHFNVFWTQRCIVRPNTQAILANEDPSGLFVCLFTCQVRKKHDGCAISHPHIAPGARGVSPLFSQMVLDPSTYPLQASISYTFWLALNLWHVAHVPLTGGNCYRFVFFCFGLI